MSRETSPSLCFFSFSRQSLRSRCVRFRSGAFSVFRAQGGAVLNEMRMQGWRRRAVRGSEHQAP
eukprot:13591087-Alexandrium_andersonii.AAC.1